MTKQDKFEAADSANGYLYQTEYALWLALTRSLEDATYRIAVESIDDVEFANEKGTTDLVQVKYRVRSQGNLTDASTDLWKTLRIWCEGLRSSTFALPGTTLFLVTTQVAAKGSIAGWLTPPDRGLRDCQVALDALRNVAATSESEANAKAYLSFRSLTPIQQDVLLGAIQVLDAAPHAHNLREKITNSLVRAVDRKYAGAFYERLFGWWLLLVSQSLHQADRRMISAAQIEQKIAELREAFRRDSLPIDYLFYEPTSIEMNDRQRLFVEQLKLIMLKDRNIEFAVRDYYAAYHQRSKWLRDGLVAPDELRAYEQRLIEEWERYFELTKNRLSPTATEGDAVALGQDVYKWVSIDNDIRLRPLLEAPFVRRGSYHQLADSKAVGWHPHFVSRLEELFSKR